MLSCSDGAYLFRSDEGKGGIGIMEAVSGKRFALEVMLAVGLPGGVDAEFFSYRFPEVVVDVDERILSRIRTMPSGAVGILNALHFLGDLNASCGVFGSMNGDWCDFLERRYPDADMFFEEAEVRNPDSIPKYLRFDCIAT